MIVAPPSGNTDQPESYQVLHTGFDTLTIAVKATLPPDLFNYLEGPKQTAEQGQRDVLIEWNSVQMHLKGHGGSGNRFVTSGGTMGANWAFKKPNAKDPWGVRVPIICQDGTSPNCFAECAALAFHGPAATAKI